MGVKVEFSFRVWIGPEEGPQIEVWHHELEPTGTSERSVAEWARESLCNEDFYELFEIDEDEEKYWQILGKGTLQGSYDYFGEYDEEFDVIEYEKAEALGVRSEDSF